jgi:NADH:ubiquinone oxidoreductase subunit 5 (subunit L)/multisubunit Na+/H+ antiporter MnhA subunit
VLRRGRLRKSELWLVWVIGLGLFAAGITGMTLAVVRRDWKTGLAGAGIVALAAIYFAAARSEAPSAQADG